MSDRKMPEERELTVEEWREVAVELADKLLDRIWHFCWNISGDSAEACFEAHANTDVFTLAELYLDEEDVELIRSMDNEVYADMAEFIAAELERIVEALLEEREEEAAEEAE